jgi:hypothetical protein
VPSRALDGIGRFIALSAAPFFFLGAIGEAWTGMQVCLSEVPGKSAIKTR